MTTIVAQLPVDGTTENSGLVELVALDAEPQALRYAPFQLAALTPDLALSPPNASTITALQNAPRLPGLRPLSPVQLGSAVTLAPAAGPEPIRLAAAAAPDLPLRPPAPTPVSAPRPLLALAAPQTSGGVTYRFTRPDIMAPVGIGETVLSDALPSATSASVRVRSWYDVIGPATPEFEVIGRVDQSTRVADSRPSKVSPQAPLFELLSHEAALQDSLISASLPPAPLPPSGVQTASLPDANAPRVAPLPRPVLKPTFDAAFVRVHAPTAVDDAKVQTIVEQVSGSGVGEVDLKRVELRISRDNVRYFHAEDAAAAAAVADATGALLRDFTTFSPLPPSGSIEYWVAGTQKGGSVATSAARTPQRAATTRRAVTVSRTGPTAEERRLRAVQQRIIQRLRRGNAF